MRRVAALVSVAVLATAAAVVAQPAAAQADPNKVLRVAFPVAETGFDPQASNDLYSNHVNRAIFDTAYVYDYLARPFKLVPNTAVALPTISPDGLNWTFRIKPGIYFNDDPAFKGQKRELTAADYVYSWKRILDPKVRSPNLQLVDGLFVGAEAAVAKAKETGKFDYDAPLEGLQATDRYTIRIKLTAPSYDLLSNLTQVVTAAVAREVIEAYGDASTWAMANPVGTGPYRLKEWRRGQKIVLEANPGFRDVTFPDSKDPADRELVAKMHGKKLPRIGRVEISIIEESQPRLLGFERGDLDYVQVPNDLIWNVIGKDNKLQPRFAAAGVTLARGVQPAITYTFFNMEDPVVGGYSKDKVALRRAIGMAYNVEEEIRVLRQGQARPATQVIPPNVTGHDPNFTGNAKYDPDGAKALLDKFGYVDRDKDGWRDMPDGKPLVLKLGTSPTALERQYNELWQRNLTAVGIKVEFQAQKFADLLKMARYGQLQAWTLGNISTTPEGYQFLGLLYGGFSGLSNLSRFKQADYDRLYDQSRSLPDGPQRTKLFREMAQLVSAYAPWLLTAYRLENIVVYPWVLGFKYNEFQNHPWMYYDIDLKMPRRPVQP
ncbi:MAG TPA: ABC transporter substrate-binding protein [Casimicrobiaceae bacterium]|nr:ABC transporter substrate-binding protein [Casimicrobiaceae bacterium]